MADNTTLNTMSGGDVIADEDIGGVKFQKISAGWGPAGTWNKTDIASGKPFPVQNRGSDGTDRSINAYTAAVTLTRTADTNAYTAGDVMGAATGSTAALNFASMGPSGGIVEIVSASLEIDKTAIPSGMTSFRAYLFNVTPPSAFGDNAAWTGIPSGDRASFLGYIDFGTPIALGTSPATLYVRQDNIGTRIKLSGTSIFAYLITNGAYTPASADVHVLTLHTQAP
jgi:hypothetical protein